MIETVFSRLAICVAAIALLAASACSNNRGGDRLEPQAKSGEKSVEKAGETKSETPPVEESDTVRTVPPEKRAGNRIRAIEPGDRNDGPKADGPTVDGNVVLPFDLATFMGAEAKGNRFCIIADASNSMRGAPIQQVKAEILKTLSELKPTSKFYVIFFNSTDAPMPHPDWLSATPENVAKIRPWVNEMNTVLKTLPQSSFERAFKLTPNPDVIFFMTDGLLQGKPDPVTQLQALNAKEPRTTIHTIMFSKGKGNPAAVTQLRAIAEGNRGTFRSVNQK